MPDLKSASRYSRALFTVAQRQDRVDPTCMELSGLVRALEDLPELRTLWYARLPVGQKTAALESVFKARLSPLVLQFLKVLATRRKERLLPGIARSFDSLSRKAGKRQEVEVVTALPLPDDLMAAVMKTVAGITGAEPELRFSVDPGLLGGILLRIGDRTIDASVKGRIELLRAELVSGSAVLQLPQGSEIGLQHLKIPGCKVET